jgi:hypothetical protein
MAERTDGRDAQFSAFGNPGFTMTGLKHVIISGVPANKRLELAEMLNLI